MPENRFAQLWLQLLFATRNLALLGPAEPLCVCGVAALALEVTPCGVNSALQEQSKQSSLVCVLGAALRLELM